MMTRQKEIPCNFVGYFKTGDNLVFNCKLLCDLVEANDSDRFNKMIVLQVASILEAALSEIIFRAQSFSIEGVPNISDEDRDAIAGKKIDKFATIIDVLRKYEVLDGVGSSVYGDLHKLRKYRNKIHIQGKININGVSRDEQCAFSPSICDWALNLNLVVIEFLSDNLPRPENIPNYVGQLLIPSP